MNIDERVELVINKITGGISALTYGYFSHINGGTLIKVSSASETEVVDKDNIGNLNCSTNILNKLIGKYKKSKVLAACVAVRYLFSKNNKIL